MSATTITTSTFTLKTTSGATAVSGTVALAGNTATFTPSAVLSYGTQYTATLTTGVQDSAGNALAAQQQWSFMTAAVPTFNISGTVTGPYVEGVTITMSGGATDTAVTNAMGVYSFATSRPAGSYTLTPSLPGYTYSPSAPSVAVSANTTQNFTASSASSSYSISGTVTSSSLKTGRTRVQVFNSTGCTNCSPVAGISIASPGTGAYTIRGVPPGSYVVKASTGYLGTGAANATNPSGVTSTVTVGSANLTNVNIAIADPAAQTATTPTGLQVSPANGSALILWDPVENANGTEKVTAYKIYWGTDTGATSGSPIIVGAREDAHYFQSGLTDTTSYYYKIASCVSDLLCSSGEGTVSAVVGPVTIGATIGSNTVSGTVTIPGTPAGSLYVVLFNPITQSIQFTRIANPGSAASYSIAGVPSGTLGAYIVLDTNSNGYTDLGELSSDVDRSSNFAVSGNTTRNFTLSSASTKATVGTHFFSDGTSPATYSLQMEVNEGTKRPVNVTLVSGANVAVPLDMGKNQEFRAYQSLNTTAPMVGDTYVFKVTFSDGTTETVSRSVSAVPGLSAMAQNLLPQTTTPGTPTVPLFTWAAPSSPPLSYTYDVWVSNSTAGGSVWNTHDGGLPSTTTSVLYNADGKASSPSLTSGTTYYWQVTVEDANGNQATKQTTYVP